ncbi:MAG: RDD family protein [Promethearchaeota archaeon]
MSDQSLKNSLDLYIDQINRLLPYKKAVKLPILEALREEVMEALTDAGSNDPTTVYGAPRDVAKNLSLGQDWGVRASFKRRTVAYSLDVLTCFVLLFVPGIILTFIFIELLVPGITPLLLEVIFDTPTPWIVVSMFIILIFNMQFLLTTFLSPIYFILLERLFATTLAKRILGLKVCDASGIRITLKQSIIRNFSKLSPLLLVLDVLIGRYMKKEEHQRVLDLFAETIVLKI